MTENPWPHDESLEAPSTARQVPSPQGSELPSSQNVGAGAAATRSQDAGSVSDVTKKEAAQVAQGASGAVQNVTGTAKSEAANVAAEVKSNARDLFAQAKSDLTDQAGTQQQKVAEGLRSVSTELHSMLSSSDQSGVATDLVRQAAERSSTVASWLEGRDPGSLLDEVKSFARQKPGTFLLLAAGAGILAGRLTRSLSAGAPDQARTAEPAAGTAPRATRVADTGIVVPPAPVELPATGTTTGLPGTYPADSLGSEPLAGAGRQDLWDAEPVVTDPLPPVVTDPLAHDPFDGGRR